MKRKLMLAALMGIMCGLLAGCPKTGVSVSDTGLTRAHAKVPKGSDGLSTEQRNVKKRLELDNTPGSIKHLYLFSAMNGQCILYSTVKGKVTSSGKRLSPTMVTATEGRAIGSAHNGMPVQTPAGTKYTPEMIQDDGTYGSSIPYLYWWDANGKYMQIYVTGGTVLTISDQPISVRRTTIDLSLTTKDAPKVDRD